MLVRDIKRILDCMDKDMPVTFYTLLDEGLTEVYLESIRESDGQCEITVDLGDGFIRAVDARTRRIVGAEHECSNNDVIKIHAKS